MKRFLVFAVALVLLTACGAQSTPEVQVREVPVTVIVTSAPLPTYTPYSTPESMVTTVTATPEPVTASTQTQPSPAAAPSSGAIPLDVLSHTSYVDGESLHIVGEVRNNVDSATQFVEIVATLYGEDDQVVGTDNTFSELDIVPPGGKSPFEIVTDEWTGMTSYKLQAQGLEAQLPRQDLVIVSHESYVDSGGWFHVRGEVQNTGNTPAEFVKLAITLYDADGSVVGSDFTYTDLTTVPAGDTLPFESGMEHWADFDHYDIQVQGK